MKKILLSTVALLSLAASLQQIIKFLLKNPPLKRFIVSQVEIG